MEWWVKEYGPIDKIDMGFENLNMVGFRFSAQYSSIPLFQHSSLFVGDLYCTPMGWTQSLALWVRILYFQFKCNAYNMWYT